MVSASQGNLLFSWDDTRGFHPWFWIFWINDKIVRDPNPESGMGPDLGIDVIALWWHAAACLRL